MRTNNNSLGTISFLTANIFVLVANLFYGININALKYLMPKWISPSTTTMVRCVFAALVFFIISYFIKSSWNEKVSKRDYITLLLLGAVGTLGYWELYMFGLNMTSPVDSSIIMSTSPIWVLILASIFFKEKVTKRKVVGLIIGFSGCLLVILKQSSGSENNGILGDSICALSALLISFNIILSKKLLMKYHPLTILRTTFLSAGILSIPITFVFFKFDALVLTSNTEIFPLLVFISILIFPTIIAQLLISIGEKKLPVTIYSMYKYVILIVASTFAVILGQDSLSWYQPVAAMMIFYSVYIVTTHSKSSKAADNSIITDKV